MAKGRMVYLDEDKKLGHYRASEELISELAELAKEIGMSGSTDVADVSWVVPTVQLWGANYTIGTPFHSWQMTAQRKSSIAIKGMTHAATAMAATGVDVLLDKKLREDAWLDLQKLLDQNAYVSPLLDNAKPPIKDMAP